MQESDLHTAIMRSKLELESNGIDLGSSSSVAFHVGNTMTSCPAVTDRSHALRGNAALDALRPPLKS